MTAPALLAFAGSTRLASFNRLALEIVVAGARDAGASVDIADLADYPMPIYQADEHAAHGVPATMRALRARLIAADGLLLASPEYNGSITPLLKNTIDWLSQPVDGESGTLPFSGKMVGLCGASPGAFGAVRALPHVAQVLSNLGAIVLPIVGVPLAGKLFDADGKLHDEATRTRLTDLGARVVRTLGRRGQS